MRDTAWDVAPASILPVLSTFITLPQDGHVYFRRPFIAYSYGISERRVSACAAPWAGRLPRFHLIEFTFSSVFILSMSPCLRSNGKVTRPNLTDKTISHTVCIAAAEMIQLCLSANVDTNDGVLQSNRPQLCTLCGEWGQSKCKRKLISRRAYFGSTVCHPFHGYISSSARP